MRACCEAPAPTTRRRRHDRGPFAGRRTRTRHRPSRRAVVGSSSNPPLSSDRSREASHRRASGFGRRSRARFTTRQDEDMKKSGARQGQPASKLISKKIAELGDWRGGTLSRMRKLIKEADPDVVEEWKWMGTPVWS